MRDLTSNEIGAVLFKIRSDLEVINGNLSKWRLEGIGPDGMVPLSVIVAETRVISMLTDVEELIQLMAKISTASR
jgi:hypothetical protein